MRKLILAPMALACLIGSAAAQQAPTMNVGNFPATQAVTQSGTWGFGLTGPIPAGSSAIGSVLADLRVSGAAVASANPVPVSVGNFPGTQAVSQSGTWTFGLSGPIPAGSNVIGAVSQSGGPWSVSGTIAATQSGTWGVGLNAGTNAIGSVQSDLRVAGSAVATGNPVPVSVGNFPASQPVTNAGTFTVQNTAAMPAGNAVIGKVGIDQTTPGTTNGVVVNSSVLPTGAATATGQTANNVSNFGGSAPAFATLSGGAYAQNGITLANAAGASLQLDAAGSLRGTAQASSGIGGLVTVSRIVSAAASANPTLAKGSPGRLYKITGFNAATSVRWLRFFNKASVPTPGTDTAAFALPLPPGAFSFDAAELGFFFSAGIGYGLTTGPTDADAGALTAGDILNLNVWVQ